MEEKQAYYEQQKAKAKEIAERLLRERWGRDEQKGSRVYKMTKARVEQYGSRDHVLLNEVKIPRQYLKEIAFTLRSPLLEWAKLRTRAHFWKEYTDFKKLEYWYDTPMSYRLETEQEGIEVPDITERVVEKLIVLHYWKAVGREHMRTWHREGSFKVEGKISQSVRREIERCEVGLLEGEGWKML